MNPATAELHFAPASQTTEGLAIPMEAAPESVARFEQLYNEPAATSADATVKAAPSLSGLPLNESLDNLGQTVMNYTEQVSDRWQGSMESVLSDLMHGPPEEAVANSMRALVHITFAQIDVHTATSCGKSVESSVDQLMRNA